MGAAANHIATPLDNQKQSTDTAAVAAQSLPQSMTAVSESIEPTEISFADKCHADYQESLKNPSYVTILMYLIDSKMIDSLRICFNACYDDIYPLVELLVLHGQFDYLNRLFDLLRSNDIPCNVNKIPVNKKLSLLISAYNQCINAQTRHAKRPYEKIIKLLLDSGADITCFIQQNIFEWVEYLIQSGARREIFDANGYSILYKNVVSEQMTLLLSKLHVPSFQKGSCYEALANAVEKNDFKAAAQAIDKGAYGANLFNKEGQHLLAIAARNGNAIMCELLLYKAKTSVAYLIATNDCQSMQFLLDNENRLFENAYLEQIRVYAEGCTTISPNMRTLIANAIVERINVEQQAQQIVYSSLENDFWCAVAQFRFAEAERLLQKAQQEEDPIRLRLQGPRPGYNVLTYALAAHDKFAPNDFIIFLLKHCFNQIYPLIQDMVRNNQCAMIHKLIKLGLNVNAHPCAPGDDHVASRLPWSDDRYGYISPSVDSLLRIALETAATKKQNIDVAMVVLLLNAGASIPALLREKGFLLKNGEVTVLEISLRNRNEAVLNKFDQAIELAKAQASASPWEVGILIYQALTRTEGPMPFPVLPTPVVESDPKSMTRVATLINHGLVASETKNAAESSSASAASPTSKISRKRQLQEKGEAKEAQKEAKGEIKEEPERPVKRFAPDAMQIAESKQEMPSSESRVAPSASSHTMRRERRTFAQPSATQPSAVSYPSEQPFDTSRWLSAITIPSSESQAVPSATRQTMQREPRMVAQPSAAIQLSAAPVVMPYLSQQKFDTSRWLSAITIP